MNPIYIETIPHAEQRYDTVGDYGEADGKVWFKVSDFGQPDYEMAVSLHELVEKHLKDKAGITDEQVDAFDLNYKGPYDEPGLDPACPYHKQHMQADAIERAFVLACNQDWIAYEAAMEAL